MYQEEIQNIVKKSMSSVNIVWFKRDLRIYDHTALIEASNKSDVLLLYILEPELWAQPDLSYRQYNFLQECILDLKKSLKDLGHKLVIKVGDSIDVFKSLNDAYEINAIYSHQETWNGWTYERDKKIKKWLKEKKIPWNELKQNGVIRKLRNRNLWGSSWYKYMNSPIPSISHSFKSISVQSEEMPTPESLGLKDDGCLFRQSGGRDVGLNLLNSFLTERGKKYTKEMSSPVTAFESCSRLSAHFAFGTISIREAYQSAQKRLFEIKSLPYQLKGSWESSIKSFLSRLRWHCHFIQKLENNPTIEFQNVSSAYNHVRKEEDFNQNYFDAWKHGKTGYPMIDACMRALKANGWINFRMRAMLMSFASYHLWLHWRKPALHLANLFTDYEPGIHYSQVQMQSATTGINAIRIYNPIKQGIDQDPTGVFIKKWVPEISHIPQEFIHTPWECKDLITDYPLPIVDEKQARKYAADILYAIKKKHLDDI